MTPALSNCVSPGSPPLSCSTGTLASSRSAPLSTPGTPGRLSPEPGRRSSGRNNHCCIAMLDCTQSQRVELAGGGAAKQFAPDSIALSVPIPCEHAGGGAAGDRASAIRSSQVTTPDSLRPGYTMLPCTVCVREVLDQRIGSHCKAVSTPSRAHQSTTGELEPERDPMGRIAGETFRVESTLGIFCGHCSFGTRFGGSHWV